MPITTPSDELLVGAALRVSLDKDSATNLMRAPLTSGVEMNYSITLDDKVYGAHVLLKARVVDPHELLGENPTMFDVLSLLLAQCAAARLE